MLLVIKITLGRSVKSSVSGDLRHACPFEPIHSKIYYVTLDTKLGSFQVCVRSVQFTSTLFDITTLVIFPNILLPFETVTQRFAYDTTMSKMHTSNYTPQR